MALEAENVRLREALVYAERGWRDALGFAAAAASTSKQGPASTSRPEDLLEIRSLQHEVNMLQRQILKRSQMADELQRALSFSADELEQCVNKIIVNLHAEVPSSSSATYAPPLWTVEFPSDSEVFSSTHLVRLGRTLRRAQAVAEWIHEHNMERFPHYEQISRAVAAEEKSANSGGQGHDDATADATDHGSVTKKKGLKKKKEAGKKKDANKK